MPLDQIETDIYEDKKEMSFFDHIDELRKYLFRSVIAIFIGALLCFFNKYILFDIILFGPVHLDFPTYKALCKLSYMVSGTDEYCITKMGFTLSNISMTGQFTQHLFIAFIGGIVLAFPFILWQVWLFIRPALSKKEISHARGLVFFSSMLFFIGVGFGYFLLTPVSVNFLGNYKVSESVSNEINLESYISFLATMTLACGIVFEMPILAYFLVKIGLLSGTTMRKFRKHAFIIILIAAAILTPSPDIASQMMMTIPLYGLYELSILIAAGVERKAKKLLKTGNVK